MTCSMCPESTQSQAGSKDVEECSCFAGYTATSNGVTCSPCPENTFKTYTGIGECTGQCPEHLYSQPGSDSISDCTCSDGKFLKIP